MSRNLLIVDDNEEFVKSMILNFELFDLRPVVAHNGSEALAALNREHIDVCLLDIRLGLENGIQLLSRFLDLKPHLKIIMVTGHGTIDAAVESLKLGAFDFIQKPVKFSHLYKHVTNAFELTNLDAENHRLRNLLIQKNCPIITNNATMAELVKRAEKLAKSDLPVLITGENGTGKENFADYIHMNSARSAKPIIKINTSAFPETLIDNELFGHNKGAFTDASSDSRGVFEQAHEGTLFLDEIGDMPLGTQAKILRVLQNNEIRRIGAQKTTIVDVRFLTATNKDLKSLMESGQFRQDLFFRLSTAILSVPPLRERRDDIPMLIDFFLDQVARACNQRVPRMTEASLRLLMDHDWPGNVRELKNAILYAAQLCDDDRIKPEDLPPAISKEAGPPRRDLKSLKQMEREHIMDTLAATRFNKKEAAGILRISRGALYRKLEQYGIQSDNEK
jgi:two-component system, NtrC family, response regulator AtoC